MLSIGWVIFGKALVLATWAEIQDVRTARKERGVDPSLLLAFKEEWERRCAKHPRALPDLRPRPLNDTGPVD
jgi:hypothetical protein